MTTGRESLPDDRRESLFWRLHRRLGSGLRWDLFWQQTRHGHLRVALAILVLPPGWSMTNERALAEDKRHV